MAVTIKHKGGKPDETVTPTGSSGLVLYGPPPSGSLFYKGVFLLQSAGATPVYRHVEELCTPGVSSPSSYAFP